MTFHSNSKYLEVNFYYKLQAIAFAYKLCIIHLNMNMDNVNYNNNH